MTDLLGRLLGRLMDGRVARGSAQVLALRAVSIGLGFLLTWSLARILGPSGFGAYAFALSWLALLSIPGLLGSDKYVIREVAAARERGEHGRVRGLLLWSTRMVLAASTTLVVVAFAVAWGVSGFLEPHVVPALLVGICAVPILALLRLRQSVLVGFERVGVGQAPEWVVRPGLAFLCIGGAWMLLGHTLEPALAVVLYAGATLVALVVAEALVRQTLDRHPEITAADPIDEGATWLRGAMRFLVIGGVYIVIYNTDIVMLGFLSDAESVGIYRVASRCAEVLGMVMMAVAIALAPRLASLHAAGKTDEMQTLVRQAIQAIAVLTLPGALVLVALGPHVLGLFGEGFTTGTSTLYVLCIGTTLSAILGPATTLLMMTGHEREVAGIIGGAALVNIALNVALIPTFDALGAAVATAVSALLWVTAAAAMAWRRLGIRATPF